MAVLLKMDLTSDTFQKIDKTRMKTTVSQFAFR